MDETLPPHPRSQATDRTWPLPRSPWAMRMGWHDLLFAHWQVDPNILSQLIPPPLELDLRDGEAWIGIVPFRMTDVAPRCVPAIPGLSAFPELNVRTYVTCDGKPGIWFFSLDATSRLAVRAARKLFHLPYMDADMSIENKSSEFRYQSLRTHAGEPDAQFVARYSPTGPAWHAQPETLEHWLTARYCLYSSRWQPSDSSLSHSSLSHSSAGQSSPSQTTSHPVYRGEIDHPPWPLQNATCQIEENTMCQPIGLELNEKPHLLFVRDIHVRAWLIHRV